MNATEKKPYDLEERTFKFAKRAMGYFKLLPRSISSIEIAKQGIRSAVSVGANFIEANEALSKKDFVFRAKICRKEAKETVCWLKLSEPGESGQAEYEALQREIIELMNFFGTIIEKSK